MGNTMEKRAYRLENRDAFTQVISHYKSCSVDNLTGENALEHVAMAGSINVYIRKRPMLKHEYEKGEFDVVSTPKTGEIVVHQCMPWRDLKPIHAFVDSRWFPFLKGMVFHDAISSEEVYESAIHPILDYVLSKGAGQRGTLFMYGQTGSGKTHTTHGVMQLLCKELFAIVPSPKYEVSVISLEMKNDVLYDILHGHKEAKLLQGRNDEIHVTGADETPASSPQDLWRLFEESAAKRETHATAVNSNSSRSHFIFRILVRRADKKQEHARLTIVDLAGSERNADSLYHDVERQKESAWINSSLMAVKDVIRITAENRRTGENKRVPFRSSTLTQLLRDCFDDDRCTTAVIAAVSPISTDTEHTMNTLTHVGMLTGINMDQENLKTERMSVEELANLRKQFEEAPKLKRVQTWNSQDVKDWLQEAENGKFRKYAERFAPSIDGGQLSRFTEKRFTQITGNESIGRLMRDSIQAYIAVCNEQKKQLAQEQRNRMNGKF